MSCKVKKCDRCKDLFDSSVLVCPKDATPLASVEDEPARLFGKYKVIKEVAQGGAGKVYLAVHEQIGSKAALKVLSERFSADSSSKLV